MTESLNDYALQVGDVIVSNHPQRLNRYVVHRVTNKYAFVKYNDVAEGKFPRVVDHRFQSLPRQQWSQTTYYIEKAKP